MQGTPSELVTKLYRAGAGAGKTTTLIREIVALAREFRESEKRYPNLVVTTFTKKATQELRERLLDEAKRGGDPGLIEYFGSQSQMQVSTIHGVLSVFLRQYGHRLGFDPSFRMGSAADMERLSRQVLKRVLFKNHRETLLEDFDVKSLGSMLSAYGRSITEYHGIRAPQLGDFRTGHLRLRHKTATELEKVITEMRTAVDPKWLAFLDKQEPLVRRLRSETWNTEDRASVLELVGLRQETFSSKRPPFDEELKETFTDLRKQIKVMAESEKHFEENWPKVAGIYQVFEDLAREYLEQLDVAKKQGGILGFDDLEILSARLAAEYPETARSFSLQWDYWLVDEFQDTSPLQDKLLTALIGTRKFFLVGDPQQSIYLFRGARTEVFEGRLLQVKNSGGRIEALENNHRSAPELVHFFNDFFSTVPGKFFPMNPVEKADRVHNPDRFAVTFLNATDSTAEQDSIFFHVQRLLRDGAKPETIGILARNNETLEKLSRDLVKRGVAVHLHGRSGFVKRREVLDALSILRFLANPLDRENLFVLLRSPWARVPDETLVGWAGLNWLEICAESKNISEFPILERLQRSRENVRVVGVLHAWESALVCLGLIDFAGSIDPSGQREASLWKLVTMAREKENGSEFDVIDFLATLEMGTADDEITEAIAALEPNRINAMTVHGSKGLQFRHVVLADFSAGVRQGGAVDFAVDDVEELWFIPTAYPGDAIKTLSFLADTSRARRAEAEISEMDRLLYVALTRAQSDILISWNSEKRASETSWRSRTKFPLEFGEHRSTGFTYRVVDSIEAAELDRRAAKPVLEIPRFQVRPQGRLKYARASATSLLDGVRVESGEAKSLERMKNRVEKSIHGVLAHRVFEALSHRTVDEARALIGEWFGARSEPMFSALDYVLEEREPPLREIISGGSAEWGFLFRDDRVFEGQIDLWGPVGEETWIVDYKTGSMAGREKAFLQLGLYAEALRRYGVKGLIRLAVVYPFEKKSFLETPMPWPELKALLTR